MDLNDEQAWTKLNKMLNGNFRRTINKATRKTRAIDEILVSNKLKKHIIIQKSNIIS